MTAMMAFFLVMWLINSTDKKTLTQVATYFNPMRLTDKKPSAKGLDEPEGAEGQECRREGPRQEGRGQGHVGGRESDERRRVKSARTGRRSKAEWKLGTRALGGIRCHVRQLTAVRRPRLSRSVRCHVPRTEITPKEPSGGKAREGGAVRGTIASRRSRKAAGPRSARPAAERNDTRRRTERHEGCRKRARGGAEQRAANDPTISLQSDLAKDSPTKSQTKGPGGAPTKSHKGNGQRSHGRSREGPREGIR